MQICHWLNDLLITTGKLHILDHPINHMLNYLQWCNSIQRGLVMHLSNLIQRGLVMHLSNLIQRGLVMHLSNLIQRGLVMHLSNLIQRGLVMHLSNLIQRVLVMHLSNLIQRGLVMHLSNCSDASPALSELNYIMLFQIMVCDCFTSKPNASFC